MTKPKTRLSLKKKTLRTLDAHEAEQVRGGAFATDGCNSISGSYKIPTRGETENALRVDINALGVKVYY
jgi:hypothetical protein